MVDGFKLIGQDLPMHLNVTRRYCSTINRFPSVQLAVYAEILLQKRFEHVADIDFSWFNDHKRLVQAIGSDLPMLSRHSHVALTLLVVVARSIMRCETVCVYTFLDETLPLRLKVGTPALRSTLQNSLLPIFTFNLTCDAHGTHTHVHARTRAHTSTHVHRSRGYFNYFILILKFCQAHMRRSCLWHSSCPTCTRMLRSDPSNHDHGLRLV